MNRTRTIDWSHALAVAEAPPHTREEAEPKDFNVHVRVRNGKLLAAIHRAGFASVSAFCRANGLEQHRVSGLVTMRISPLNAVTGLPTAFAQKVADALDAQPMDLFPPRQLAAAMQRASRPVNLNLSDEQIEHSLHQPPVTPEQYLQLSDAQAAVGRALNSLRPRKERVLRLRYAIDQGDEQTLDEVGARCGGVGRERVRQIEQKALRKLQHPVRSEPLRPAANTFGIFRFERDDWHASITAATQARRRDQANATLMAHKLPSRPVGASPSPEPAARPLRRRVRFPPQPLQAFDAALRADEPDYIRLLRIPPHERSHEHRLALAYHLEQEFCRRGAGMMAANPAHQAYVSALYPQQLLMEKYEWLMVNLPRLWAHFPPAPVL